MLKAIILLLEIMLSVVMLAALVGFLVLPEDAPHQILPLCFIALYHMYRRTKSVMRIKANGQPD